jgi:hypothetical protein
VDADAGHLLLLQFLRRRLRLQSLRWPRLNDFECNFVALVSATLHGERREHHPHKPAD